MATVIERKQTAFRLSTSLLNKLKEAAERENRSLNNYVESVLMDAVNSNPNKLTLAAMKEARENRDLETLDADNLESVVASLQEYVYTEKTGQFKKDLKRIQNNSKKIEHLKAVLTSLQETGVVPENYNPHKLTGNYNGFMECHVENDLLLIWLDEEENIIKLVRLGSHSELF